MFVVFFVKPAFANAVETAHYLPGVMLHKLVT
jgi:hypothetical protein